MIMLLSLLLIACILGISGMLFNFIFWACVRLPLAIVIFSLGIVCCSTVILIPAGIACFKSAGNMVFCVT